jgi:hypothetical protein
MNNKKLQSLLDRLNYGSSKELSSNKIYITLEDFNYLSKFEKNLLITIGKIYGIITDGTQEFSYNDLINVFNTINSDKSDMEKSYLLSLFFPEKIQYGQVSLPFPVPTYTYVQKYQTYISPNINGCFLAQMTCVKLNIL